jgi:hypothetical protein
MRFANLIILCLGCLLAASGCTHNYAPGSTWTPEKSAEAQLGAVAPVGNYTIRPPAGFQMEQGQMHGDGNSITVYKWDSPVRADGTVTVFSVHIGHAGPGYADFTDLSKAVQELGQSNKLNHNDDYVVSPVETGTINGIPFARVYWKGTFTPTGTKDHGFFYLTGDSSMQISIHGTDSEPYSKDTLSVCEAAALTFQKS